MLTMLLGGIWHGAAWKFVMWGALHGGGLAVERMLEPWLGPRPASPLARVVSVLVVFHFVCLAWIFFRAEDFDDGAGSISPGSAPAGAAGCSRPGR